MWGALPQWAFQWEREKEQAQTLILGIAWFTDSFHVHDLICNSQGREVECGGCMFLIWRVVFEGHMRETVEQTEQLSWIQAQCSFQPGHSKCGPWSGRTCITWEVSGNESLRPDSPSAESESAWELPRFAGQPYACENVRRIVFSVYRRFLLPVLEMALSQIVVPENKWGENTPFPPSLRNSVINRDVFRPLSIYSKRDRVNYVTLVCSFWCSCSVLNKRFWITSGNAHI